MLLNPPISSNEYRHNYVRLSFIIDTLILFFGYAVVNQLAERGNNRKIDTFSFFPLSIQFRF